MNPNDYTTPFLQATGNLNAQSNGSTPATPVLPAGQANDIILLLCFARNTTTNFTTPAGYTVVTQLNAGSHKFAVFWKRHTGSESNPSVANPGWTNTNILAAKADIYRGCKATGVPYEALNTNTSASGVVVGASVTTTGIKRLALNLFGRFANAALDPDAVWTERYDAGTSGGGGCRFYVDSRNQIWPGVIPACSRSGANIAFGAVGLALIGDGPDYTPVPKTMRRGLWVWDFTTNVVGTPAQENLLLNECVASSITDLYVYTFASEVVVRTMAIRAFITKCTRLGVRVWGLDGDRAYFSDLDGPQQLIDDLNAIIAYNATSATSQRFHGFQLDIEPPDNGSGTSFHNGVASSVLSITPGSGNWQNTAALDREYLMRDWVQIHQDIRDLCTDNGLQLASALPTFFDDYFGEPISCTFNGVTQNVFLHLLVSCDVIALMSYNTTPSNVVSRLTYEFDNTYSGSSAQIGFSYETATGVGSGVSYGDTVGKQSRAAMLADEAVVTNVFAGHPSYLWFNIHDWAGYRPLSPGSSSSTQPAFSKINRGEFLTFGF